MTFGKRKKRFGMRNSRSGIAMTELLVSLLLACLLMTAGIFVFARSMVFLGRMEAAVTARSVSDRILERITEEISVSMAPDALAARTEAVRLSEDGSMIQLYDRSGRRVMIYASEYEADSGAGGELIMEYQETITGPFEPSADRFSSEKERKTDKAACMGFSIKNLTFTCPDPADHPEVIRIDLTLYDSRTEYEYTTYAYVHA